MMANTVAPILSPRLLKWLLCRGDPLFDAVEAVYKVTIVTGLLKCMAVIEREMEMRDMISSLGVVCSKVTSGHKVTAHILLGSTDHRT